MLKKLKKIVSVELISVLILFAAVVLILTAAGMRVRGFIIIPYVVGMIAIVVLGSFLAYGRYYRRQEEKDEEYERETAGFATETERTSL